MSNAGDHAGAAAAAATPSGRAPRLPRWTRQEILVLIEGKRIVEVRGGGRGGRGRVAGAAASAAALEPKWAAVADYCRRHGVERGPVQCRKRWSNLAGDYKKIKEWERAAAAAREPSFWAMRNDSRRERRLPGFFDREVYDILEGRSRGILAGSSGGNAAGEEEAVVRVDEEEEEEEEEEKGKDKEVGVAEETVFDSGRPAGEDTLFSEDEEGEQEETPATMQAHPPAVVALPISEKSEASRQQSTEQAGTSSKDKQPRQQGQGTERGASPTQQQQQQQSGQKRQRTGDGDSEAGEEGTAGLQGKLLEILDRNSRMVAAQLEAQNVNWERDREQRRDQADSLAVVLGRLADALGRIADKL